MVAWHWLPTHHGAASGQCCEAPHCLQAPVTQIGVAVPVHLAQDAPQWSLSLAAQAWQAPLAASHHDDVPQESESCAVRGWQTHPLPLPPHTGVLLEHVPHNGPHVWTVVQSSHAPPVVHRAPSPHEVDVQLQSAPVEQTGVADEHWHARQVPPLHHWPVPQEVAVQAQTPVPPLQVGSDAAQLQALHAPVSHHVLAAQDVPLHVQAPLVRLHTGVVLPQVQALQLPPSHHFPSPQSAVPGRHCLHPPATHHGAAVPVHCAHWEVPFPQWSLSFPLHAEHAPLSHHAPEA